MGIPLRLDLLLLLLAILPTAQAFSSSFSVALNTRQESKQPIILHGAFFEEPEDDLDDDDDDEPAATTLDDRTLADFRTRMDSLFDDTNQEEVDELIQFAVKSPTTVEEVPWARPCNTLQPGALLVANPAFFSDAHQDNLEKYGLTMAPPLELGPDRRADLMPVLMIVEMEGNQCRAVLLNRRTGYLLGDLGDNAILEKFCIQPLWFGGVDRPSSNLEMLHLCPHVQNTVDLGDGLYWGGDPQQAQTAMDSDPERIFTGFDFKFYVQSTVYDTASLQQSIEQQILFCCQANKSILFKSRDRCGTRRAKPLWTEIMELLGDTYVTIKDDLYLQGDAEE